MKQITWRYLEFGDKFGTTVIKPNDVLVGRLFSGPAQTVFAFRVDFEARILLSDAVKVEPGSVRVVSGGSAFALVNLELQHRNFELPKVNCSFPTDRIFDTYVRLKKGI